MRYRFLIRILPLVFAALLVACQDNDVPADVELRVMTFNIEWGGTNVSFDNVVEAIRLSSPDIVGVQEAEGNLERLADALGWEFDRRNYVISRFPLIDPPGADGKYVLVEIRPGLVVAMANLHLPSDPYGPDMLRDGATADEVVANERDVRMPTLQPYLKILPALARAGTPLFLSGDFNAPSHEDWQSIEWPVSLALQAAGLKDTWRVLFPDPSLNPGFTWWAGRPPLEAYSPGENDAQVRIDHLWFAGPVNPKAAVLIGERGAPEVTISVAPWPSDHRAVVATFAVQPVPLFEMVTTDRRVYRNGDDVTVIYKISTTDDARFSIVELAGDKFVASKPLKAAAGRLVLPSPGPGHYRLEARVDSATVHREFWVLQKDAVPAVEMASTTFARDVPIPVRWYDAPGNRNDYIALYAAGAADDVDDMLAYAYVDAQPSGELDLQTAVPVVDGVLEPGRRVIESPGKYVVKLMKDDGYEALSEAVEFEVLEAVPASPRSQTDVAF